MENLHLVPNPALIEIDGGFKVLMYHGAARESKTSKTYWESKYAFSSVKSRRASSEFSGGGECWLYKI